MLSLTPKDIAEFLSAGSRARKPAEDALKDLEARRITAHMPAGAIRKNTPRAICDSAAQKAGKRLSDLTAADLADLLWRRPGRPVRGAAPVKSHHIKLEPSIAEQARAIGGGNLTAGIVLAVSAYRR